MVAFTAAVLVGILVLVVPYKMVKKRRPGPAPLTWGEAMAASAYVFFLSFWWYGVIPHQWLTFADNELLWRKDKVWYGPADVIDKLPFSVSYLVLRDLIVIGIYAVGLVLFVALWMKWQNRGKTKPSTDVARSNYGRPLVKA